MGSVNWRRVRVLVGETMREIGILFLVFAPLDAIIEGKANIQAMVPWMIAGATVLIVIGIALELEE